MLRHLSVHAPRLALNYSTRLVHRGSRQSLMTRAFSSSAAALSPPSKAIVYEAHGDEVGGGSTGGSERKRRTWLTYIVKDEKVWHKIEKGVPMEYAATITVNPLTALLMLEHCVALNSGDAIVQNGATSMVGQCVIQIAKSRGIPNINIIRDRMELTPFDDFNTALDKAMGKLGSQPKQVIKF
ncbi:Enoyl-[acyl-carrier-protein] reductase, mitochondrial [Glycine soja]|uniref:Enoyl-[acyl-carrier-protein] reductase, mitochondrial n=1 Tax=Glycine soja TaxID=3848 RepID=A0A445GP84_GLYSO|nr:Enoyl-[acyl-carrier-protein] reductase, mitochondrial [Glycine soja]